MFVFRKIISQSHSSYLSPAREITEIYGNNIKICVFISSRFARLGRFMKSYFSKTHTTQKFCDFQEFAKRAAK